MNIFNTKRYTEHPTGPALYKEALYPVRPIENLKEMLDTSCELFAECDAFWVKEPRAFGESVTFDRRGLPERLASYRAISYQRFTDDVKALANVLYQGGEEDRPQRIAILGNTRYEWYVTYLAVLQGPAVVVPLDKELPENELLSCLDRAHCDVLFVSGDLRAKIQPLKAKLSKLKTIVAYDEPAADDLSFWELLATGRAQLAAGEKTSLPPVNSDQLSILLFTSGTTSQSKVVMLSQRNIASNLMAACQLFNIGPEDRFLSVLPLHHTYECSCGFLCATYRGTCIAIGDGLRYIPQNIQEAKPTVMLLVPLMLETFYKRLTKKIESERFTATRFRFGLTFSKATQKIGVDLSERLFQPIHEAFPGIRSFIVGGAAVDAGLINNWQALGFNCLQGYGLTESSPILALNHDKAPKAKAAGLPVPGTEIRILNPDEDGIGEVLARGPGIMLGYYEDEEKTREAIDEEGFLHTGDLGYLDEDYNLILTGRKANLIVSKNGKNIFPEEIEFLFKDYPLVEEVVVRMARDTRGGDQLIAEIFPSKEFMENDPELSRLSMNHPRVNDRCLAIIEEVNRKLVSYKHLRAVLIRQEPFEKTTTKKIRRNRLFETETE